VSINRISGSSGMALSPSWVVWGPLQTQEPYTTKMQPVKPGKDGS
jgi:hypothetical protein